MSMKAKKGLFLSITAVLSVGLVIGTVLLIYLIWVNLNINLILASITGGLPASALAYFLGNALTKRLQVKRWQFLCCFFLPSVIIVVLIGVIAFFNRSNPHQSDNLFSAFAIIFQMLLIIGGIFAEYMIIMGLHSAFLDLIKGRFD